MKVLDAVVCKADNEETFKKMRKYIYQVTRIIRSRMGKSFYHYKATFTYVTNTKDKTVQIKCNHGPSLDELEYCVRKYIQSHLNCGWDRTVIERDA